MTANQTLALKGVLVAMRAALEGMQRLVSAALALLEEEDPDVASAMAKIRSGPGGIPMFGETPPPVEDEDGG